MEVLKCFLFTPPFPLLSIRHKGFRLHYEKSNVLDPSRHQKSSLASRVKKGYILKFTVYIGHLWRMCVFLQIQLLCRLVCRPITHLKSFQQVVLKPILISYEPEYNSVAPCMNLITHTKTNLHKIKLKLGECLFDFFSTLHVLFLHQSSNM